MVKISVVMAVYNGAARLSPTIDALLAQTETDFELIVVDDGSTDATLSVLDDYASRDPRIRVIRAAHGGLTASLIRGCAEASAPLIAREDCGDLSHPERLRLQSRVFDAQPDVVLVSCGSRFLGPEGEDLFTIQRDGEKVRQSLLHDDVDHILGIGHHSSAMFRTDVYRRVGGYRREFYFAQDLDLWVRLAAEGRIVIVNETLHDGVVDVSTVSGRYRREQIELAKIALQLRSVSSEEETRRLLAQAAAIGPRDRPMSRVQRAKALYFIASVLAKNANPAWRRYLRESLRLHPLQVRGWLLAVRQR